MKTFYLTALIAAIFCLGACGVKPSTIEAPSGKKNDQFPRTYPDISYDPAP